MPQGYVTPGNPPPSAPGTGSVSSGTIGSGQVGNFHVASGQIQGLGATGVPNVASGSFTGFELGSGSVVSGRVASGQVGFGHLANASVQSGTHASGSVAKQHTASGLLQGGFTFVIDGGGAAPSTGDKGDLVVPFDCKINYVNLFSDVSGGSIFLGVWRDSFANYPPVSGDTIAPSGVPLISGAIRNSYSGTAALSGWTTSLTKGDVLKFVVLSGLTMTRACVAIQVGVGD
jgi:hypothetical protein